jgi:hypothetical protein
VAVRFLCTTSEQFSKKYLEKVTISLDKKWNEFNMWRKVVGSGQWWSEVGQSRRNWAKQGISRKNTKIKRF